MLLRGLIVCLALVAGTGAPLAQPAGPGTDPEALPDLRVARGSSGIAAAWLIAPTDRYDHFVQGSRYEAGGVRVRLDTGKVLTLMLDSAHVFEDRQPRLADIDGNGEDEVVLVLTSVNEGASVAVLDVTRDDLALMTKSPFIGRPHRWLNPAGLADFTGDGAADIALVAMPHLARRLEIWTLDGGVLRRIAMAEDVSNHRHGSPHTAMSATAEVNGDGRPDLIVPDGNRTALRALTLIDGAIVEIGRTPLPAPADGTMKLEQSESGKVVTIRLETDTPARVNLCTFAAQC